MTHPREIILIPEKNKKSTLYDNLVRTQKEASVMNLEETSYFIALALKVFNAESSDHEKGVVNDVSS